MSPASAPALRSAHGVAEEAVAAFGRGLAAHQREIRLLQWGVIALYLVLVAVPAFLDLPPRTAHLWSNLTLFAQFAFWGVWWPFVLLSMVLVGRSWCGFLCPEGALTGFASRWSLGRHVPRWLTWNGWPFVAFAVTTVYGQMVSVYQYPKPVLLVLGGSTAAAVAVGLVYGRNKRVWCRYLCPVNGVFTVLAKVAPVAFEVDRGAWDAFRMVPGEARPFVNCAPLVPIRQMKGAGTCHMCGRCEGFRGAIRLRLRSPNHEIVHVAGATPRPWESVLILFGMMGVALGAFHWPSSPWFVTAKQEVAERLVEAGILWPLERSAPWWVLTDYPALNDVMTLLDGALLVGYVAATALLFGGAIAASIGLATAASGPFRAARFHHLVQTLIPVAACGVFLGLFSITVAMLRGEGFALGWLPEFRAALLAGASLWSVSLAWQVAGLWAHGARRAATAACVTGGVAVAVSGWVLLFWVW